MSGDYQWLTTAPNPRSPATGTDAGQRGWRTHAVKVPQEGKFSAIRFTAALCGLTPRHGWGSDLFIDEPCARCSSAMNRLDKQNDSSAAASGGQTLTKQTNVKNSN